MRRVLAILAFASLLGGPARTNSPSVTVLFDSGSPSRAPFPSDLFTVADDSQLTGMRVELPKPDCALQLHECDEIDTLNELDGFSTLPRLVVPFSDPIDPSTLSTATVALLRLGDVTAGVEPSRLVAINRIVWDPDSNTAFAEPHEVLDQHSRYLLFVTRGVRDPAGTPVQASAEFRAFSSDFNLGRSKSARLDDYRRDLRDALAALELAGTPPGSVVGASIFTTTSVTATLEHMRASILANPSPAVDFNLGAGGFRTTFPIDAITTTSWQRQVDTSGGTRTQQVALNLIKTTPRTVGTVAFGKVSTIDYLSHPSQTLQVVGTRTGVPEGNPSEVYFNLFLPAGARPPTGWPVVIVGHGGGDSKQVVPFRVGASLAAQGMACIAINLTGYGGGALGTLTVNRVTGDPIVFPAGGRTVDQNGDGLLEIMGEGFGTAAPRETIEWRDVFRQDIADIVHLVRAIQDGMDADGDGSRDLDPTRIYYYGHSRGGRLGVVVLAVEPAVRAGVLTSPGITAPVGGGAENLPFWNEPPFVNDVPGAISMQESLYRLVWASAIGSSIGYAPFVKRLPLPGVPEKRVLLAFAKGDSIANPVTSALIRAADIAATSVFFRADLFFADNPQLPPIDPHDFVIGNAFPDAAVRAMALGAQAMIAKFLATDGIELIQPPGVNASYFEVPIVLPLPERPNFIPSSSQITIAFRVAGPPSPVLTVPARR